MDSLKDLFKIEKKPRKGLIPMEWVVVGYMLLTTLVILFTYTKLVNPESMLWGRFRILAIIIALWGVYRMIPCGFLMFCRIAVQMLLLSWWYPDTYEINRIFPNLDHIFATWEQQLFSCQPALLFSQTFTNSVFSELMHMGYSSYYPLIFLISLFYFFCRRREFERTTFVILTAFFIYYVIFIFLPVTGPQYYYLAAGVDQIAQGNFPNVGDYFSTHSEALTLPGWQDGFFYNFVAGAHNAGERPTAAFPSSHVGITTILLLLAWRTKNKKLISIVMFFYILMCFATVYIQAHYAIDVIGGWISAVIIYVFLQFLGGKICPNQK